MCAFIVYFTLSLLPILTLASPSNFSIANIEIIPCLYKVSATAAQDLSYIDVVYSTKGANPNSLASSGPGISVSNARTKCYVNVDISYPYTATRARATTIGVEGSVTLERGMTAHVETSILWGSAWSISNFTTITVEGPSTGLFTGTHNLSSAPLASFCEAPPTVTRLHIANGFSISSANNTGATSGFGVLGANAELKMRVNLEWLENCEGFQCKYVDRYGNVWYVPPYDAEICSD